MPLGRLLVLHCIRPLWWFPSELRWFPSELRWFPSELRWFPSELRWFPSELGWFPSELRWFPSELRWFTSELRWFPSEVRWFPSELRWFPSELRWFPSELRWFPSELRWIPSELRWFPSELRWFPSELRWFPSELRWFPSELRWFPSELRWFPSELRWFPSELRWFPSELRWFPSELRWFPSELRWFPSELRWFPSELRWFPSELRWFPSELRWFPSELRWFPSELRWFPSELRWFPSELRWFPSELRWFPSELRWFPSELRWFPSELRWFPSELRWFPSELRWFPSELRWFPSELRWFPSELRWFPSELRWFPSELRWFPSELRWFPSELRWFPSELRWFPSELRWFPSELRWFPSELRWFPSELRWFPSELRWFPSELRWFPSELRWFPSELRWLSSFTVCVLLHPGGSSFIIRLWGSQADVPVQSLHLAFGVGALVAPQIARPFLVAAPSVGPSSVTSDIDAIRSTDAAFADVNATWRSTYDATNATSADVIAVSAIEYPYSIIAALTALVAATFLVLACASPLPSSRASPRPPRLSDLLSPHRWLPSSRRRALGLAILAALFLFFTLPVGAERSFGRFLYAFAVEGAPRLPPAAATALESVFWTSFTVGRGTATVLARWVPAAPLLALELSLTLSAAVALLAGANTHPALLWGGTAAFGAGLAPLFPTAIVWANAYVDMAGMMTSVAFVAAATGAFVFSWLAGYLFQYAGPSSVLTFAVVFAVIAVVVFATLRVLASFYGPRYRSVPIDDLQLKVVDGPRTPMLRSREPHATP